MMIEGLCVISNRRCHTLEEQPSAGMDYLGMQHQANLALASRLLQLSQLGGEHLLFFTNAVGLEVFVL